MVALTWARHLPWDVWIALGIGALALVLRLAPLGAFSAEYDEGVYWQSLRALAAGHPLYSQVFSSQPPLFLALLLPVFVIFGQTLASDVRAVYVTEDPDAGETLRKRWERQFRGVPLVIVESPYRALIGPVTAYLDVLDLAWPPDKPSPITIVVLPEYVARHWWDRLLYNQSAKRLKAALVGREHTVIADVPYRRGGH